MSAPFVYVLESDANDAEPKRLGVFPSYDEAVAKLKTQPRDLVYAIYQTPDEPRFMVQKTLQAFKGVLEHWRFGSHKVRGVELDENGNVTGEEDTVEFSWPL